LSEEQSRNNADEVIFKDCPSPVSLRNTISNLTKRLQKGLRKVFSKQKKSSSTTAPKNFAAAQVLNAREAKGLPTKEQVRYLPHLLSSREKTLATIAIVGLFLGGIGLVWSLINAQRTSAPAIGAEYTEGLIGTPQLINPLYASNSDVDTDLSTLLYSGLMQFDSHEGLIPDLAASVDISEDGTEYLFTLHENAHWHDGRPVISDDVIFTFSAIKNMEYRSPLAPNFEDVTIDQIDRRTVRFTLAQANASFLSELTVGLLPSHLWQEILPANAPLAELNTKPIGSGPYQFEKLTKDTKGTVLSYTLKRHPQYHGDEVYIETLQFKFYPDVISATEALRNHNIEGLAYIPADQVDNFEQQNNLRIHRPYLSQYIAAYFNQNNTVLSDLAIRDALVQATDKETLVNDVLFGQARVVNSFLLEGMIGYQDDVSNTAFDVASAESLLDTAGWTIPENSETNLRQKDNQLLSLELVTLNSQELTDVAQYLVDEWRAIGVDVQLRTVDITTFQNDVLVNRDYDILLSGEMHDIEVDAYAFWHSSQTDHPGLNVAGYENSTVDDLIESARTSTDVEARTEAYRSIQEEILSDTPALFLYQPTYAYATSHKIKMPETVRMITPSNRFSTIDSWYIKTRNVISRNE
jgi:peptide/nickel transport system substrate-binding protein